MIKIKEINKKAVTKLSSYVLTATMLFTAMPTKVVNAIDAEDKVKTITLDNKDYDITVEKDGDILIKEDSRRENKVEITTDGKLIITSDDGKSCYRDTIDIENFNAAVLEVDKDTIKSSEVESCIDLLAEYFYNNKIDYKNYVKEYGDELFSNNKEINTELVEAVTKEQYSATYNQFNIGFNGEDASGMMPVSNALVEPNLINPELMTAITAAAGASASAGLAIAGIVAVTYAGYVIIDGVLESIDSIDTTSMKTLEDAEELGFIPLVDVLDDSAYAPRKPNINISKYYVAYIVGGQVVINPKQPLDEKAATLILQNTTMKFANVYTFLPVDATKLFTSINAKFGCTNNKGGEFFAKAECHAYKDSYNSFDSSTFNIIRETLIEKENAKPGAYFWHYHFLKKEMPNLQPSIFNHDNKVIENKKHAFFGEPEFVK